MKFTFSSLFFLVCFILVAQESSVSPFSAFGYGERKFYTDQTTRAMGGTSVAYKSPDGNEFNFQNPATNTNLEYTTFNISSNTDTSSFDEDGKSISASSTYISRASLGLSLGKKASLGLSFQPFSGLGYDVSFTAEDGGVYRTNSFEGSGTLNDLELAYSRKLSKELSFGLSTSYLFGKISRNQQVEVEDSQLITEFSEDVDISGSRFSFGLFFEKKLKDEKYFNLGATLNLGTNIRSENQFVARTFNYISDISDIANVDTIQFVKSRQNNAFPKRLSFGGEFGESQSWRIAAQFDYEFSDGFTFSDNPNVAPISSVEDNFRIGLGGYWLPDKNSYKSYFERIYYRGGMFFEDSQIQLGDDDVLVYGLSLGLGLPLGSKKIAPSLINISAELGKRDPLNSDFVDENFANFSIGIVLTDVWFRKRKID